MSDPILIVGAGIAGISLGLCLEKAGIDFQIIEKNPVLRAAGAGIALPANALDALKKIGVFQDVLAAAHQVKEIIYANQKGRVLAKASLLEPPLNYAPFVALHRETLMSLLSAKLKTAIRFDCAIKSLSQNNTGVEVQFSSGEHANFSTVIGADGLYSSVRQLTFAEQGIKNLPISNWRYTLSYPTNDLQPSYLLGRQSLFLAYPIGPNDVYCYAQNYDVDGSLLQGSARQRLLSLLKPFGGIAKTLLPLLPSDELIIPGRLASVQKPLFANGRIGLIGDASSACSPMLQQGAASAFEDAVTLTTAMQKKVSPEQALLDYQQQRQARVNWIVQGSDLPIAKIATCDSWLKCFLRDQMIRKKGPLNVVGWRQLFSQRPLAEK